MGRYLGPTMTSRSQLLTLSSHVLLRKKEHSETCGKRKLNAKLTSTMARPQQRRRNSKTARNALWSLGILLAVGSVLSLVSLTLYDQQQPEQRLATISSQLAVGKKDPQRLSLQKKVLPMEPRAVSPSRETAKSESKKKVVNSLENKNSKQGEKPAYDVCIFGKNSLESAILAERYSTQLQQTVVLLFDSKELELDNDTILYTNSKIVGDYVQDAAITWEERIVAERVQFNDTLSVPIPVNLETVNTLFHLDLSGQAEFDSWLEHERVKVNEPRTAKDILLATVGPRLYESLYQPLLQQRFGVDPSEQLLPTALPPLLVRSDVITDGKYEAKVQGVPLEGYQAFALGLRSSPLVTTNILPQRASWNGIQNEYRCHHWYYSGPIDGLLSSNQRIPYRSVQKKQIATTSDVSSVVVHHLDARETYRTTTTHSMEDGGSTVQTTATWINSTSHIGMLYPIPTSANQQLHTTYQQQAARDYPHIQLIGGLATQYQHWSIDETILHTLQIFKEARANFENTNRNPEGLLQQAPDRFLHYDNGPVVPSTASLKTGVQRALQRPIDKAYGLKHKAHPPGTNVIMGLAAYPENMDTWRTIVGALRKQGYEGHFIFGVHPDMPSVEEEYLKQMEVTFYTAEVVDCHPSVTAGMRGSSSSDAIRGKCARGLEKLKLEWARFEMARQWLNECSECTGWSLVMDTRDILFQNDPFQGLPDPALAQENLLLIEELGLHTNPLPQDPRRAFALGSSGRYADKTSHCYGVNHYASYYYRPVLCSGTIIGTREGMNRFLSVLVDEFYNNTAAENRYCRSPYTTDQWTMNYLYYNGRFGEPQRTKTLPWGTGPVLTIGKACVSATGQYSQKDITLIDNTTTDERILNPHEHDESPFRVAAAVHQFDRCDDWITMWMNRHADRVFPVAEIESSDILIDSPRYADGSGPNDLELKMAKLLSGLNKKKKTRSAKTEGERKQQPVTIA